MEESRRDGDHPDSFLHRKRNSIFTLQEILFSANIASSIGYALLVYISKNQALWTPANDSTYYFLRSAYRINDFLRFPSSDVISTKAVARQFPSQWSRVGDELLIVVTVFGLSAMFFFLFRLLAGSRLYPELLRRVGGATAPFAAPACYLYVSKLTRNWGLGPLPERSYTFWQRSPLIIFGVEILCLSILFGIYRKRSISARPMGIILFLHYAFWSLVLWPQIGISLYRLYSPYALLLVFPLSGIVWLVRFKRMSANSTEIDEHKRAGRWTYVTAILALAILLFAWLPSRAASLIHPKDMESLTIEMSRGPCYGWCPSYTLTIHGNGSVDYVGYRYVNDRGPQTSAISREKVMTVIQNLDSAHFLTLEDRAFSWCFDSGSVAVSVSTDGRTKRVVSDSGCVGAKAGAQAQFVQAADEIDAIVDSKQWVERAGLCKE